MFFEDWKGLRKLLATVIGQRSTGKSGIKLSIKSTVKITDPLSNYSTTPVRKEKDVWKAVSS